MKIHRTRVHQSETDALRRIVAAADQSQTTKRPEKEAQKPKEAKDAKQRQRLIAARTLFK